MEGTVNSSVRARVKNEFARQAYTDASKGSLGFSLLKSSSISGNVKGSRFDCFEDGGARLAALIRAALTCVSSMAQVIPWRICHALTLNT
jgi:hypothetical protein